MTAGRNGSGRNAIDQHEHVAELNGVPSTVNVLRYTFPVRVELSFARVGLHRDMNGLGGRRFDHRAFLIGRTAVERATIIEWSAQAHLGARGNQGKNAGVRAMYAR